MAQRLAARPEILDKRRETVEYPFGSIKQWMNQGAFLMRGLANVNAEFSEIKLGDWVEARFIYSSKEAASGGTGVGGGGCGCN